MKKRLSKVGNSKGVIIPAEVLDLIGWDEKTEIEIIGLGDGRLELIGRQPPPKKVSIFTPREPK